LRGLPLTPSELRRLARAEAAAQAMTLPWQQVAHLPFMLVTATKPDTRAASRATASS
jgi:hypothetical protein